MRFQTAFSRVRRCEPQFMEQLASKLPLNLTDAAVEEIARPLGWHDSFMKPVSICLAKAPGSGDIGRMLQGGPKAAMPPASAKQTPVAVSATASPPPAPAKAPLPAHAKAPGPTCASNVWATSARSPWSTPGAPSAQAGQPCSNANSAFGTTINPCCGSQGCADFEQSNASESPRIP